MKLTKYHKKAIVQSILNDIPSPNQDELKIKAQLDLIDAMSLTAQALYHVTPDALTKQCFGDEYGFSWRTHLTVGDADYKTIMKPYLEAQTLRDQLNRKLKAAIDGLNTRKQFIDAFPEFSRYAPAEPGATSNLPALANIVADLINAGWVQKVSRA